VRLFPRPQIPFGELDRQLRGFVEGIRKRLDVVAFERRDE
jgi:hypothetical protein